MPFPRVTHFAQDLVARHLPEGSRAIDATVGNGHDTLFLAQCVGVAGRVDGFDIQAEAIATTRERTKHLPQVRLHHIGHEAMESIVEGHVDAIMFNLGYLPSGDKSLVTRPPTTLAALGSAAALLSTGGILAAVVYPGHPGGDEEAAAVDGWFASLDPGRFQAIRYAPLLHPQSPYLLAATLLAASIGRVADGPPTLDRGQ
ncbi:MAG TPA: class I SAM-dependent methyltransferase [Bacteroidia bacterium]|nr:class I SAM-dependent methyltransferase [Bacteroidia bacterium]